MRRPTLWLLAICVSGISGVTLADGDPEQGKEIFKQCGACHTIEAGGPNNVGPNLHGVLGKHAATNHQADFDYSAALKASGLTWDDATLDKWIRNPAELVPGTKMEFVGLSSKQKREAVLAYLKQAAQ